MTCSYTAVTTSDFSLRLIIFLDLPCFFFFFTNDHIYATATIKCLNIANYGFLCRQMALTFHGWGPRLRMLTHKNVFDSHGHYALVKTR